MINCPKCGADNMIGAIFCRTCGDKLNLQDLKPDVFDAPPEKVGAKIARIGQRIAILVVGVVAVGLIGGLFWPVGLVHTGDLDQAAQERADRKFQGLQKPVARMPAKLTFTSNEATFIANKALNLPATGGGNRKPQAVSVEFTTGGNCRVVLKSALLGRIPMFTEVVARPTVAKPGEVAMHVSTVRIGRLPLKGNLRKQGLAHFEALNVASVFAPAEARVSALMITSDSCEVTWKR